MSNLTIRPGFNELGSLAERAVMSVVVDLFLKGAGDDIKINDVADICGLEWAEVTKTLLALSDKGAIIKEDWDNLSSFRVSGLKLETAPLQRVLSDSHVVEGELVPDITRWSNGDYMAEVQYQPSSEQWEVRIYRVHEGGEKSDNTFLSKLVDTEEDAEEYWDSFCENDRRARGAAGQLEEVKQELPDPRLQANHWDFMEGDRIFRAELANNEEEDPYANSIDILVFEIKEGEKFGAPVWQVRTQDIESCWKALDTRRAKSAPFPQAKEVPGEPKGKNKKAS